MNSKYYTAKFIAIALVVIVTITAVTYVVLRDEPFSQEKYDSGYTTAFNLNATVPPAWMDFFDQSAQAGFDDGRAVFTQIYPLDDFEPHTHTPLQRLRETLPLIKQSDLIKVDLKQTIVSELETILQDLESHESQANSE